MKERWEKNKRQEQRHKGRVTVTGSAGIIGPEAWKKSRKEISTGGKGLVGNEGFGLGSGGVRTIEGT